MTAPGPISTLAVRLQEVAHRHGLRSMSLLAPAIRHVERELQALGPVKGRAAQEEIERTLVAWFQDVVKPMVERRDTCPPR